jgi:hypothetical protein
MADAVMEADPHRSAGTPAHAVDGPTRGPRWRRLVRRHWAFGGLLLLGLGIRIVVQFAYRPALIFPDSRGYLLAARPLTTLEQRPNAYSIYLAPFLHLSRALAWMVAGQHVLALASAVAIYLLLVRRGVRPWLAALGTAPLLLDASQVYLEQFIMADTLANVLLVAGVVLLLWLRSTQPIWVVFIAGLLLGMSTATRVAGIAVVLVAAGYVVLMPAPVRRRLIALAAIVVGAALPVAGYMTAYNHEHGSFALSGDNGVMLYGRVSQFVDCAKITLPEYERQLCPTEPVDKRQPPDFYSWGPKSPAYHINRTGVPKSMSNDDLAGNFAKRAMRQQKRAFVGSIVDNIADTFLPPRGGHADFTDRDRWLPASTYPLFGVNPFETTRKYDHTAPVASPSLAKFLHGYGRVVVTPGPLLLATLVLALVAGFGVGRARRSGQRLRCLALALAGFGPVCVSAISAFSTLRYQQPAVVFFPAAAALAITALIRNSAGSADPAPTDDGQAFSASPDKVT